MKSAFILMAAVAAMATGCVERKLTITSEPPGAIVRLSNVEIGRTPVTIPFTWYGDYEITIEREGGYAPIRTHADINPPLYEYPPWDLFSEIAPWTYKDHRYLHYRMEKAEEPTDKEIIDRAKRYRTYTTQPGR